MSLGDHGCRRWIAGGRAQSLEGHRSWAASVCYVDRRSCGGWISGSSGHDSGYIYSYVAIIRDWDVRRFTVRRNLARTSTRSLLWAARVWRLSERSYNNSSTVSFKFSAGTELFPCDFRLNYGVTLLVKTLRLIMYECLRRSESSQVSLHASRGSDRVYWMWFNEWIYSWIKTVSLKLFSLVKPSMESCYRIRDDTTDDFLHT